MASSRRKRLRRERQAGDGEARVGGARARPGVLRCQGAAPGPGARAHMMQHHAPECMALAMHLSAKAWHQEGIMVQGAAGAQRLGCTKVQVHSCCDAP